MSAGAGGRYAVVGGGMSGLAAAHHLVARGLHAELFERDNGLGGRCRPAWLGAREISFGGKNVGRRYTLFREFTAAHGDNPYEFFGINSSRVEDGTIRTFDSTRRVRSVLALRRRMTTRDAVRFARLVALVRAREENRYLGSRGIERVAGEDDRPLTAYFSERFCSDVLRSATVRMNGAEPDEAYVGGIGTNLGMVLDSYDQLSRGMGRVLEQFAARHSVHLGGHVTSLRVKDGLVRGVHVRWPDGDVESRDYDGVVLAVPAYAAADLLREHDSELARSLGAVRYFPAAVAVARYDRPIFSPQVRALVFPAGEPISNAGAYGIHERDTVRYTFSGRGARERLNRDAPTDLVGRAEELLDRHVPFRGANRVDLAFERWRAAYCAYLPRHWDFLTEVERGLSRLPGLGLAGDYLRGASIEACFRSARDCAASFATLESPSTPDPAPPSRAAA